MIANYYNTGIKSIFAIVALVLISYSGFTQHQNSQLTQAQKDSMLDAHNFYRAEVGVDSIKWDEQLAIGAQEWADKLAKRCTMRHNTSDDLGENLYWTSDPGLATDAVHAWGSEKKYYHGGKNINSKNGHYTQMVWYSTTHVGCAFAKCKKGGEIWVCRYKPAGNMMGERAYPRIKKK